MSLPHQRTHKYHLGTTEKAEIPFDFIVRGKTLPAGTYVLRRINDTTETLEIENFMNHEHVMFQTEALQSRNAPRRDALLFHRYGDTYFLRQIRVAGEADRLELAKPREERRLQNEAAENNVAGPDTVAVLLH
ncbi:MAG TPA: hypothetical protein VIV66_13545 [Pyrinomonadaceae bacterium]